MIAISWAVCLAIAAEPDAADKPAGLLFAESFNDAKLGDREWYDFGAVRIAGNASAGKGCLEYEWVQGKDNVQGSSPARRLFERNAVS